MRLPEEGSVEGGSGSCEGGGSALGRCRGSHPELSEVREVVPYSPSAYLVV
jgi:hypothetical protein